MKVGSLVVGVDDPNGSGIRFAGADANSFHSYIRKSWPDSPADFHVLLLGQLGSANSIEKSAEELAAKGPFDYIFVYLAGHGLEDTSSGGRFVTSCGDGLGIRELDRLLGLLESRVTLLFLDCCHAAAVLNGSRFFSELQEAEARLFICSSRKGQLTWEDEREEHGIFSALLLHALATGHVAGGDHVRTADSFLAVDRDLFPYLCQQVPLAVYELKGGSVQEPVKGGSAQAEVRLPVRGMPANRPNATVTRTIIRRLRHVAVGAAIAALTIFIFAQLTISHAHIRGDGQIEIRRGPRALQAWTPSAWRTLVETDFVSTQIEPQQLKRFEASGVFPRIFLHRSKEGYRAWIDDLLPRMLRTDRAHATFELLGTISEELLDGEHQVPDPGFARTVGGALLLGEEQSVWLSRELDLHLDSPKLGEGNVVVMDFNILGLTSEVVEAYIWAVSAAAAARNVQTDAWLRQLREAIIYRGRFEDNASEWKAWAEALLIHGAASISDGRSPSALISRCPESEDWSRPRFWCEYVRSRLGRSLDPVSNPMELLSYLAASAPTATGSALSQQQDSALDALARVATGAREVREDVVNSVLREFSRDGSDPLDHAPVRTFLKKAAGYGHFPASVVEGLLRRALADPKLTREFDDWDRIESLEILTRNHSNLTADALRQLKAALSLVSLDPRISAEASLIGWLGYAGLAESHLIESLRSVAANARPPAPLPKEFVHFPGTVVTASTWSTLRDLERATALTSPTSSAESIITSLRVPTVSQKRSVARDRAVRDLLRLDSQMREPILKALTDARDRESEPEVRARLTQIVVGVGREADLVDLGLKQRWEL